MKSIKFISTLFMAMLLMAAAGCAGTTDRESTGEYIDDSVITTKVKAAILAEPALEVLEINVETFKGVVQLSGFVSNTSERNLAVSVARGVNGVKSVKDDMQIK